LVILSGPSCVGKSPRVRALKRFHPELAGKLRPLVLGDARRTLLAVVGVLSGET
jgi:guanylate kinase